MNKRFILGFILGAIIFSCISVYATLSYEASQINYKNTRLDLALDDLYTASNSKIDVSNASNFGAGDVRYGVKAYNKNGQLITGTLNQSQYIKVSGATFSTQQGSGEVQLYQLKSKYKYFKLTETSSEGSIANCTYDAWSEKQAQAITISLNTQYNINDSNDNYNFVSINVRATSTNNSWSRCWGTFQFYN